MNLLTRVMSVSCCLWLAWPAVGLAQAEDKLPDFGAKQVLSLYDGAAPGSESWVYTEKLLDGASGPTLWNVVQPRLLYFPAENSVGTAMIVAPGGGFRALMMGYEGVDIAKRLNAMGVDVFVLVYRLKYDADRAGDTQMPGSDPQAGQDIRELVAADGRRAMEIVRTRADEWNVNPQRIGIIGFSAGGGPIRGAMEGEPATRPNFVAMIYTAPQLHGATQIPEGAPPLFLAVAADDPNCPAMVETFGDWQAAKLPVELHVFQMGAHGFVNKGGGADHFMDRLGEWLQVNGWLTQTIPVASSFGPLLRPDILHNVNLDRARYNSTR